MSHNPEPLAAPAPVAVSPSDPALGRYVPPHLMAALAQPANAARARLETHIHLACARYTIGTYLPRHLVAREIERSDGATAHLEWVAGALLFADVSGSTALAERLTALGREGIEIVTDTLNEFFDTMIAVTDSYGGDLISFGGDALLVFFDGPEAARTATVAAWELLERLKGFARTVPGMGTFPLTLHIGVEGGTVALGSAGQPDSLRYWALGTTVNAVAQAEGFGGKGELVLGPQAWSEVASDVRGIEVAPGYWRVVGLAPGISAPKRAIEPSGPDQTTVFAIPALVRQLDRLSPFLPAGLLPRILAEPQRPQVEADLRPVTVLFAQVIGLAPIIESIDTTIAAAVLDAFLPPIQAAIERFGGVVNKLDLADEGDKLLAIFGAPVAYEDHAERAARAALAVLAALNGVNQQIGQLLAGKKTAPDSPIPAFLSLRIGLNTGTVFAGNVGTAHRKEYTVMGDAVNVAARVMVKTPSGEVWCSATTAGLIGGRIEVEDRGRVAVKGKAEPLALWRISGERLADPPLTADTTPLVGRVAELAALRQYLAEAASGGGHVVRISGEAGLGKSRLTAELIAEAQERGVRVVCVTCLSYAASIPYAPWGDWLRQICGISPDDGRDARWQKLEARLRALNESYVEWLPLLADMVRIDDADTALTAALEPQMRQERTFELLVALVRAEAVLRSDELRVTSDKLRVTSDKLRVTSDESQVTSHKSLAPPTSLLVAPDSSLITPDSSLVTPDSSLVARSLPSLLVFEDLHWADQISLDLWQRVAASIGDVPLLLLGIHRPGQLWGEGQDDGAAVVALHELGQEESHQLLAERLGDLTLPDAVRDQLVLRAAGNPLFLEELLRAAVDLGINSSQNGHGTGDPAHQSLALLDELPDSLNGLLLARIDRLDESSRTLLRVASVIGQRFPMGVLQAVQPIDQRALLSQLTMLDSQELTVLEREQPERVHTFRHALLQEVAYQSLLFSRRRELHRRIGEYLERRYSDSIESYYGLLAHHYRLSDQHDKAITYLLLAGHAACAEYANEDGIQYFRWALELLEPSANGEARPFDRRLWEVRGAYGDVLSTVGRYEEALAQYGAIITSHPPPPVAVVAEAHRDRGSAYEKQGNYAAALDELVAAEELCRDHLDEVPPLLLSEVCADLGLVLMRRGEYDLAMGMCNEGLALTRRDARSREDERIEARLHAQLGNIYGMRGDYAKSRYHFSSSLAAQEEIQDLRGMVISNNNIGYLWQLQSEYERALSFYRIAEQLARKINLRYALAAICINIAGALYYLGRYDEAEEECANAEEICQSINDQRNLAQIQEMRGLIAFCRGDYQDALDHYAQSLVAHQAAGNAYQQGANLIHQAAALNALGRHNEAEALANETLARAQLLKTQQLMVEALNGLAETHLLRGDIAAAVVQATDAASLAETLGSKLDLGVAQRLLGAARALLDNDGAQSDGHFQQSMELFGEIKQRFELARTRATYAEALLRREKEDAARLYLQHAYETFVAIGAHGELERLHPLIERSRIYVAGSR